MSRIGLMPSLSSRGAVPTTAIPAESESIIEARRAILMDAQRACDIAQVAHAEAETARKKAHADKPPSPPPA